MRDWVYFAACHGLDEIMFDPAQTDYALSLCKLCLVLEQCAADAADWVHWLDRGVVAGVNRHNDRFGKPRGKVVYDRPCTGCESMMYVEAGSTKRFCSDRCKERRDTSDRLALRDVAELGNHLTDLIRRADA